MIDELFAPLLANLTVFATGVGILIIGGTALLTILFWDWRLALLGLLVVQIGVAALVTEVHGLPAEWGSVQIMVVALAVAMLLLSARQVRPALHQQRPGSFVIRLSAIILFLVGWQFVELDLTVPLLTPQETELFLWLVLCAFIMLGLGDSPLYTCVAIFFWLIPVQAFMQVLLPDLRLFVLIGIAEIFIALACSYLLLAQRLPQRATTRVLTDITFPDEQHGARMLPRPASRHPRQISQRPAPPRRPDPGSDPGSDLGGRFLPEGPTSTQSPTQVSDRTSEQPLITRRPL